MNFRTRLSLFALEERENPSVPYIDPITGVAPPPVPPPPVSTDPAVIAAAAAAAAGAAGAGTTPAPTDPLLGTNGVYNVPLVP